MTKEKLITHLQDIEWEDFEAKEVRSPGFFNKDKKEVLTDDIYYEKGVYWARGNEPKTELLGSFQLALSYWREYMEDESCFPVRKIYLKRRGAIV